MLIEGGGSVVGQGGSFAEAYNLRKRDSMDADLASLSVPFKLLGVIELKRSRVGGD